MTLRPALGRLLGLAAALYAALPGIPATAGEAPPLGLPLDCEPHRTCFLQNEVDLDPGPGVRDSSCGENTYDGHTGVDFRILSLDAMQRGVRVLAAAEGRVLRVRDGVPDRAATDAAAVLPADEGRECGNGLLVGHDDGWETQYCHLRQGSVRVAPGQRVAKGEALGLVGLSGMTRFPHVHLSLRHEGRAVDPLSGRSPGDPADCPAATGRRSLFDAATAAAFPGSAAEALLAGFAGRLVDERDLLQQGDAMPPPTRDAPVLLFFGQAINLQQGDRLAIDLAGPAGPIAAQTLPPLARHKAQYFLYAGKKRRDALWPAGRYEGRFRLVRDGNTVWEIRRETTLE